MNPLPYTSGTKSINPGPLARFLPPLEEGTVAAWLARHARPGDWVLDPFGFSPRLVLEAPVPAVARWLPSTIPSPAS
jgi:hypothetical protein